MGKLAITGGNKVKTKAFPVYPMWDEEDEANLIEALHSGRWARSQEDTKNPNNKGFIEQFENKIKDICSVNYTVAVSNCTAALDIAVKSAGIGPGDEVIVTPYSFIASATCIMQCGATPVFADINYDTWNINPDEIEKCITSKTKAIVVVHFGGQSANMDRICDIAKKHNLKIIEDVAHALGGSWQGRKLGSIGDVSCFSFQMSKNITCGEGGIVATNNEQIYKDSFSYHMSGRKFGGQWYQHELLGWNYKITEFQAALACSQLNKMESLEKIRCKNAIKIEEALCGIEGLEIVKTDERVTDRIYHLLTLRYKPECFMGVSKARFLKALAVEGIPLLSGYKYSIYKNEVYKKMYPDRWAEFEERCPVAEQTCDEAIWIPQNLLLGDEVDIDEMIEAICKVAENIGEMKR